MQGRREHEQRHRVSSLAPSLGIPRSLRHLGQSLPAFGAAPGTSASGFPRMAALIGWDGMGWDGIRWDGTGWCLPLHSARAVHIGSFADPPSSSSMLAFLFQIEIYFKMQQIYFASGVGNLLVLPA